MMRIIGQIVCPGVLLLGEVVMEPEKVAPYFGTVEKPESHMLYNVTTMATIWNDGSYRGRPGCCESRWIQYMHCRRSIPFSIT